MPHRLDPIAVGIDDEGGVVVGVIFGTKAGLTVVAAAGGERRRVERVDRATERRAEADVAVERGAVPVVRDPERQRLLLERMRLAAPVAGGGLDIEHPPGAGRGQCRVIEGAASREIAHPDRDMVDHRPNGLPPPGMRPGSPWRISPFFPSFCAFRIMSDMS